MINMMMRDPYEGGSLFAKVMNHWFLSQPPVRAHRNRIDLLTDYLVRAAMRAARQGRVVRIMSLGCGSAHEVQRFLTEQPFKVEFTLLDFNEETLQHARAILNTLEAKHSRSAKFQFVKKSVHHLLKEAGKTAETPREAQFDLVYCAGLFDYLSNPVCHRLMELTYDWTRPGGLLVATNVHTANPSIGWMELMVDWHLIYRNAQQMAELVPPEASPEDARVIVEATGVNIFLEVSKPDHA
jgi:extracellular factor (EF) 3-hydroxypalmitic acid methyl ester biosynthesis protein